MAHKESRKIEPEVDQVDFWGVNSPVYSLESFDWDIKENYDNWDGNDGGTLDGYPIWESTKR